MNADWAVVNTVLGMSPVCGTWCMPSCKENEIVTPRMAGARLTFIQLSMSLINESQRNMSKGTHRTISVWFKFSPKWWCNASEMQMIVRHTVEEFFEIDKGIPWEHFMSQNCGKDEKFNIYRGHNRCWHGKHGPPCPFVSSHTERALRILAIWEGLDWIVQLNNISTLTGDLAKYLSSIVRCIPAPPREGAILYPLGSPYLFGLRSGE
jgi:hypothetical protein